MITNKDIRVENGSLILNGDPYPLDGQSPETIMQIVEDNSDTTPTENSDAPITSGGVFTADKDITDTIGDITQTGVTGATVAAQIKAVNDTTGDITQTGVTGATVAAQIAELDGAISGKLSLFESIATTTGNSVTFTKQLTNDINYVVVMSAPTTATGRRQRLSLIVLGNNNLNEVYFGDNFTLSVNDRRLSITTDGVTYGISASILML